jgi:hypothetical protein
MPDGLTVADLDERASNSNALARTSSISEPCANATMRFICSEAFRRCSYGTVNPTLPPGKKLLQTQTQTQNPLNY